MPDHFMAGDVDDPENDMPILECFVTLGAIAAATSRIRIVDPLCVRSNMGNGWSM
jgi:alkanesulfonate monooxygenase SsuD/methylene tetrahydromethanopterin reductase-like flavin-dependent oxidoreductase (luciferase family)